ncbi:MAG: hypothetical protein DRI57_07715 [Deltaproteobacteria bacterium]|nr:MAG: hypothetical protein DRI57_07715 [Deltaproteobacteria bacterium]
MFNRIKRVFIFIEYFVAPLRDFARNSVSSRSVREEKRRIVIFALSDYIMNNSHFFIIYVSSCRINEIFST